MKNSSKKLSINKVTVAKLDKHAAESVKGGVPYTTYCTTRESACATFTTTNITICL